MDTKVKDEDHAKTNARCTYEGIVEMVAALKCDYGRLETLRDERADLESEAADYTNVVRDEAQQALADWDEENGEELKELAEAAGECSGYDEAYERIQEDPLSVEVRSGWHSPGGECEPEEFSILLGTGGPACRICGELNGNREPDRAWIEYQDWGTPWTRLFDTDQGTLLTYCRQFFFGEHD